MAATQGRLFKIQYDTGGGSFSDIGYGRSKSFTINNETVDISNETDGRWRQLLEGAGLSNVSMSMSGVWANNTGGQAIRQAAFNNTAVTLKLVDDNGDYLQGDFHITSFGESGEHNGEVTFDVSFESAGDITSTF